MSVVFNMAAKWWMLCCLTLQITTSLGNSLTLPITNFISTSRPVKPSPLPQSPASSSSPKLPSSSVSTTPPIFNSQENLAISSNGIYIKSIELNDPIIIKKPQTEALFNSDDDTSSLTAPAPRNFISLETRDNVKYLNPSSSMKSPVSVIPNLNFNANYNKAQITIKPPPQSLYVDSSASTKSLSSVKSINCPSVLIEPNLKTENLPKSSCVSSSQESFGSLSNVLSNDLQKPVQSLPIATTVQSLTLNCLSSTENSLTEFPEPSRSLNIVPIVIPSVNLIRSPELTISELGYAQDNSNFINWPERSKSKTSSSDTLREANRVTPIMYPETSIPNNSIPNNLSYLEVLGTPTFRLPTPNIQLNPPLPQSSNSIPNYPPSNPIKVYQNINSLDPRAGNPFNFLNRPDYILPATNCNGYTNFNKPFTSELNLSTKQVIPDVITPKSYLIPSKSAIKCPKIRPINTVSNCLSSFSKTPDIKSISQMSSDLGNLSSPSSNVPILLNSPSDILIGRYSLTPTPYPAISYLPSPTLPFNPFSCRSSSIKDNLSLPSITTSLVKPVKPNVTSSLPSIIENRYTDITSANILQPLSSSVDCIGPKTSPPIIASSPSEILEPYVYKRYTSITSVPPKVPRATICQSVPSNIEPSSKTTSQTPTIPNPSKVKSVKPHIEYISTPNVASSINELTSKIVKLVMDTINFNNIKKVIPTKAVLKRNNIVPKSTIPIIIKPKLKSVLPKVKPVVIAPKTTTPHETTTHILDDNLTENCLIDSSSTESDITCSKCNQSETNLSSSILPYISSLTINIIPTEEEDIVVDLTSPECPVFDADSFIVDQDPNYIDYLLRLLAISDLLNVKDDEYIDFEAIEEIYKIIH